MKSSIIHNDSCWAHFECQGETDKRGCVSSTAINSLSPRPHFGYWWDGKSSSLGDFGVVLEQDSDPFCLECLDDNQCKAGFKCISNICQEFTQQCLQDSQCEAGFKCTANICQPVSSQCEGKRKKRSATSSCSSETAAQCKAEGGYCGNPGSCPGNVNGGIGFAVYDVAVDIAIVVSFLSQIIHLMPIPRHRGGQQMSRRTRQQMLPWHAIPGFLSFQSCSTMEKNSGGAVHCPRWRMQRPV